MTAQIAAALNLNEALITDVTIDGKTVDFRALDVWYCATLSRGKIKADSIRKAKW